MSREALIVGINSYLHLPDLTAPVSNADAIAHRLKDDGDFSRLHRLPTQISPADENPPLGSNRQTVTREQLEQALKQLFWPTRQPAPDTALFYFSGHSIPEHEGYDKGYLATSDTNPNQSRSGLSLGWLQWLLSESPVQQQIIWLDCCHSSSLFGRVEATSPRHGQRKDYCFIASSRPLQKTWENLNYADRALTQALLDGLDCQRLPGQWINTSSLVEHVTQALKDDFTTPVCTHVGKAINLTKNGQVPSEIVSPKQPNPDLCPYKGLEFFDCNNEDPQYFFGREQLVGQLLDQVQTSNFIALVGASGQGKSSVLRAGLLHQLQLGKRIAGSDQWQLRITRPGRHPMHQLALAFVEEDLSDLDRAEALGRASGLLNEGAAGLLRLAQVSSAPRTILVIDQFEDVFTHCKHLEERELFFACLMEALANADNRFCLVIAMGSDFIVKCHEQEYSGLAQQIDQHRVHLSSMHTIELEAAICMPAKQVNRHVEPALVQTLLKDLEGMPDSLSLLQSTLKDLWHQNQEPLLTLASYQAQGGIQRILEQRATALDQAVGETEQHSLQVPPLSAGTQETRQRICSTDLEAPFQPSIQHVQQVLKELPSPDHHLIATHARVGQSAHPLRVSIRNVAQTAVFHTWQHLGQWMEQSRNLWQRQQKITTSALTKQRSTQNPGYSSPGLPLTAAVQLDREQAEILPLSDQGQASIPKNPQYPSRHRLKTTVGLLVPALISLIVIEHSIRENGVKQNYARLHSEDTYEEKQAVEGLVQVCKERKEMSWLPSYLAERLLGHCRPLLKAPLGKANLISTDLRSTDLRGANLRGANLRRADIRSADIRSADLRGANLHSADIRSADLRGANLHSADLRGAYLSGAYLHSTNLSSADFINTNLRSTNLRNADLINADLSSADLSSAVLRGAILLSANLRETKNLIPDQLEGEHPPLICDSRLPQNITIDRNRDCDQMAAVLRERYPQDFATLQQAERYVQAQRQQH